MATRYMKEPSLADTQPISRLSNGNRRYAVDPTHKNLASLIGWFSLGLGLAQVIVPEKLAQLIGLKDDSENIAIMRGIGVREITSGLGVHSQIRPLDWVRARIAGDAMDLALLGAAFASDDAKQRDRLIAATAAVVGVAALDLLANEWLRHDPPPSGKDASTDSGLYVKQSITVNKPIGEVFAFWQAFENLPMFISHLQSVEVTGPRHSHWITRAPAGRSVEWDAEIIALTTDELIEWRSIEGSDIHNTGLVRFSPAPGDRGTEIRVEMRYELPAGKLGAIVAKLFGESPDIQIADDLRAFKQLMETGEIVLSEGTVPGKRLQHRAAQPPRDISELFSGENSRPAPVGMSITRQKGDAQ